MKKSLIALAFASLAMLFLGCQLGSTDSSEPKTLTEKINISLENIDFQNAVIEEDASINKAKTVSNLDVNGKTLTVNVKNVTLKNVKNANVIAATGIGEGDLTIEDSTLKSLTVQGGGANSIHVKGTKVKTVAVEKAGVRLVLEEGTTLNKVEIKADNVKYEAAKDVKTTIEIAENVTSINIASGTIDEVKVIGNAVPKILVSGEAEINNVPVKVTVSATEEAKDKVKVTTTTGATAEVETVTLVKTEIECTNVKKSYKVGEKFDFTGIYLVKTYSNGTVEKKAITDESAITGFSSEKEGKVKVTVTSEQITKDFEVSVFDDCVKIDLTKNYAYKFNTEKKDSKYYYVYYADLDGVLPEEGEKVKLNIKGTSNLNLDSLIANIVYWDKDGKLVIASSSKDVEIKKNIKANEEFTATATFENVSTIRGYISLMLRAEKPADSKDSLLIFNGEIPAETKYIKAENVETGIKVTVSPKNGRFVQYNGGSISVLNSPVIMIIYDESFIDAPEQPVSYVYPFVEKDKTYYFCYEGDVVALKANVTGSSLEDYLSVEQQKRINSIKPTVKYDPVTKDFHYGFDSDITKLSDICNVENIYLPGISFGGSVLLGGEYAEGGDYQCSNSTWVDSEGVLVTFNDNDYNTKDLFEAAKNCDVFGKWKGAELTYERWKKYNFKYLSRFTFTFRTIEEPNTHFEFGEFYSPVATYEVKDSDKNLDVDTAMKNAVKNVKKYPKSQDEVISLITETYTDFVNIFAGNGSQRAAVSEEAIKNPLEAADQLSSFVKTVIDAINSVVNSNFQIFDIDFDKTVNIGELTFSDWVKVLSNSYDSFNIAMYGAKNGYGYTYQRYGIVPEGYNTIRWNNEDYEYHFAKTEFDPQFGYSNVLEWGPIVDGRNGYGYDTWEENGVTYFGRINRQKITSSAEIVAQLDSLCESLNMTREELLALLDKYVSIKNFYLHADLSIDADLEKINAGKTLDNEISARVVEDLSLAVVDVDGAIAEVVKIAQAPANAAFVSPVKAVSLDVASDIGAKSTNKLFTVITDSEKMSTPDALIDVITEADASISVIAKAAICTSAGNGGIVTVELDLAANKAKALEVIEVIKNLNGPDFKELYKFDDLKTVKISVSDGSKDTWSHEYTIEEIVNLVFDMFGPKE